VGKGKIVTPPALPPDPAPGAGSGGSPASTADRVLRAGRVAWAMAGLLVLLLVAGLVVQRISLVVVAFVLGLFPAALLAPAAEFLKRKRVPGALAALLVLGAFFGTIVLAVRLLAPRVTAQVPELLEQAAEGLASIEEWLSEGPLPVDVDLEQIQDTARGALQDFADDGAFSQGLGAAVMVVDFLTGLVLMFVVVFFVLKDGGRLWRGVADLLPGRWRGPVDEAAGRVWWTLGAYFRGQLFVAFVDAVFIGLGLWLLGVPLALPLAVLVFAGGLFPIVGAFVSGLAAVLVALASEGPTTALLVLALVIAVQQAESNLLEPLILSKVIALHPLVIILSITAGVVWMGILGAFLAVPLAASVARVVDLVRGRDPTAGPGSDDDAAASAPGGSGRVAPERDGAQAAS
jgi:putative heme transporter